MRNGLLIDQAWGSSKLDSILWNWINPSMIAHYLGILFDIHLSVVDNWKKVETSVLRGCSRSFWFSNIRISFWPGGLLWYHVFSKPHTSTMSLTGSQAGFNSRDENKFSSPFFGPNKVACEVFLWFFGKEGGFGIVDVVMQGHFDCIMDCQVSWRIHPKENFNVHRFQSAHHLLLI